MLFDTALHLHILLWNVCLKNTYIHNTQHSQA